MNNSDKLIERENKVEILVKKTAKMNNLASDIKKTVYN
jgi:hypothetical protein